MGKSVFCNKFPSMHLIKSIKFTWERSTNCLPVHLSNHQIWFFESKSRYSINLFFYKKCDFSSFGPSRDKKWPFFYKKHQIFILRLVCIIFVFYARRTGTLLFPGRSHVIISVEHVLRPGCSLFYFILLYYNTFSKTKSKDFQTTLIKPCILTRRS